MSEKGMKHDSAKVQLELLSPSWILGVGQVLTFGARKYAAHNWRLGIARSRLLGACLRHVFAYLGGQDADPETGLSHLYHASCCLMFASELHDTHPELDDRYKGNASGMLPKEVPPEEFHMLEGFRPCAHPEFYTPLPFQGSPRRACTRCQAEVWPFSDHKLVKYGPGQLPLQGEF